MLELSICGLSATAHSKPEIKPIDMEAKSKKVSQNDAEPFEERAMKKMQRFDSIKKVANGILQHAPDPTIRKSHYAIIGENVAKLILGEHFVPNQVNKDTMCGESNVTFPDLGELSKKEIALVLKKMNLESKDANGGISRFSSAKIANCAHQKEMDIALLRTLKHSKHPEMARIAGDYLIKDENMISNKTKRLINYSYYMKIHNRLNAVAIYSPESLINKYKDNPGELGDYIRERRQLGDFSKQAEDNIRMAAEKNLDPIQYSMFWRSVKGKSTITSNTKSMI